MHHYLFEREGVYLSVAYTQAADGTVTFHTLRAVDALYSPTGADMLPLAKDLVLITMCTCGQQPPHGDGDKLMQIINQEIQDGYKAQNPRTPGH